MSSRIIQKTILIDGMTCVSCENKIDRKLSNTAGVESVKVSYSNGFAVVSFDQDLISLTQIEEIIEKLDYRIKRPEELVKKKFDVTNLLGMAVIIYALYMLMNRFGLTQIFNSFPIAKEGMGYGMLFIIGILTSVHCVAMCGGICLSQCVPQKDGESISKLAALRPSFLYNLGRVISYTIIGGIIGALGSVVSLSGDLKGMVQILAGVFMVIMGLNMLNLFPWLRKLNPRMPKIFARKIYAKKKSKSPLYVGLLNGLMPCGPLQAMQLYALSTGNPFEGALAMFLFSIGTVPLMLTFGALSSLLSRKFTSKMMTAGAVMVVILGVFMFNSGISLSGFAFPSVIGSAKSSKSNVAVIEDGIQTVTTGLSSGRYEPITVQKGIPVRWIIQAEDGDINGCNNSIIIPKYDMSYDFVPGENVIEFTPTESGTIPFSCWMGMIRSRITVVDDLKEVSAEEIEAAEDTGIDEIGGLEGLEGVDQFVNYTIPTDEIAIAEIKDDIQTVEITMEDNRFSPAVLVIQRDIDTEWTINAGTLNASNEELIFPNYNTSLYMQEGENTVYLLPDVDFDFSAVDYSFFGYVKVVDDINNIDLEAIKEEVSAYVPTIRDINSGFGGASCH